MAPNATPSQTGTPTSRRTAARDVRHAAARQDERLGAGAGHDPPAGRDDRGRRVGVVAALVGDGDVERLDGHAAVPHAVAVEHVLELGDARAAAS